MAPPDRTLHSSLKNALLAVVSCLLMLAMLEAASRWLVQPHDHSFGLLFGVPLPPIKLFGAERLIETPRDIPVSDIRVDGKAITRGDLSGYYRHDRLLGYTVRESTESANGWWRSNNIGARESSPTLNEVAPGIKRLLLFGDSFAHGSGVPLKDTWAEIADEALPEIEIVNLGVDGYGMAQAYLRFQRLPKDLEHHGVIMMFVPTADLWRDVNTLRDLAEPWNLQLVLPRFGVVGEDLRLIESPYQEPTDVYRDNHVGLSSLLRGHLRAHDRFYFPVVYEPVPVVGNLVTFKIFAAAYGQLATRLERRRLMAVDSEAMQTSKRIFEALNRDLNRQSRDFYLLILPTALDFDLFENKLGHARSWRQMVDFICNGLTHCIDLTPDLAALAPG